MEAKQCSRRANSRNLAPRKPKWEPWKILCLRLRRLWCVKSLVAVKNLSDKYGFCFVSHYPTFVIMNRLEFSKVEFFGNRLFDFQTSNKNDKMKFYNRTVKTDFLSFYSVAKLCVYVCMFVCFCICMCVRYTVWPRKLKFRQVGQEKFFSKRISLSHQMSRSKRTCYFHFHFYIR